MEATKDLIDALCKMCHVQDLMRALAKVPAILFNNILQLSCAVDIVNKRRILLYWTLYMVLTPHL